MADIGYQISMAPPRTAVLRTTITIRFAPADLALIDKMRGNVTRQDWIVGVCMGATKRLHTVATREPAEKAAIKSRLKGEWKAP